MVSYQKISRAIKARYILTYYVNSFSLHLTFRLSSILGRFVCGIFPPEYRPVAQGGSMKHRKTFVFFHSSNRHKFVAGGACISLVFGLLFVIKLLPVAAQTTPEYVGYDDAISRNASRCLRKAGKFSASTLSEVRRSGATPSSCTRPSRSKP